MYIKKGKLSLPLKKENNENNLLSHVHQISSRTFIRSRLYEGVNIFHNLRTSKSKPGLRPYDLVGKDRSYI